MRNAQEPENVFLDGTTSVFRCYFMGGVYPHNSYFGVVRAMILFLITRPRVRDAYLVFAPDPWPL